MDFENWKENGYDLTAGVRTQGWEGYFELLKGHVYTKLVKQLWIFSSAIILEVTSSEL